LVSELPFIKRGLRSGIAMWLISAQKEIEGLQFWEHGYGKLLRNMGSSNAPQQASATFFL